MTGRFVFFALLAVGGAAAVPTAYGILGARHGALHGGSHFATSGQEHSLESVRRRIDEALDGLELTAPTRARAKEILESHFDEVSALLARIHSGEIDHDAAMTEHERIMNAAKQELASVLTPEQIQRLGETLHPQGGMH